MPWTAQSAEWWLDAQPQSGNNTATITVQPYSTLLDEGAHNTELAFAAMPVSRDVAVTYVIRKSTAAGDPARPQSLRLDVWPQPVPAGGILRVRIDGPAGSSYRLSLHDLLGRERMARDVAAAHMVELELGELSLTAGVYLLRVQSEEGSASKVVVVR
jgi:hypothetical protein